MLTFIFKKPNSISVDDRPVCMECIVYECKDLRFTSCPCVTLCAVSAYQLTTPYFTCTAKTEQNQHYEPF